LKNAKVFLNSVSFHRLWLSISFVIFGVLGLGLGTRVILEKRATLKEMEEVTLRLSKKTASLKALQEDLILVKPYISTLESQLLSPFEPSEYMVGLALVCARAGYSLEKFVPTRVSTEDGYGLNLALSGVGDPILLIQAIEDLPRVTTVQDVKLSLSGNRKNINIRISVLSGKGI
jgi:Tfp pilus assembly protein PilO